MQAKKQKWFLILTYSSVLLVFFLYDPYDPLLHNEHNLLHLFNFAFLFLLTITSIYLAGKNRLHLCFFSAFIILLILNEQVFKLTGTDAITIIKLCAAINISAAYSYFRKHENEKQ